MIQARSKPDEKSSSESGIISMTSRLKVLVSAFYCRPNTGSENGVGWNWVQQIARNHDVWVMTLASNRPSIEEEIAKNPMPNVHWVYFDLASWLPQDSRLFYYPSPLRFPYYYFWQIRSFFKGRKLVKQVNFDVSHHVTICRYWMPSFLAMLPVPMVWGPVGGGELMPKSFYKILQINHKMLEYIRAFALYFSRFDPFMRITSKRAKIALGSTEQTTDGMKVFGAKHTEILSQVGISDNEIDRLSNVTIPEDSPDATFRFVSIGRMIHWKGFDLGLHAFSKMLEHSPNAEYWFIGDGGERGLLERLAHNLGIEDKVKFWGEVTRLEVWELLEKSHVLVHPSLHDSGGMVVTEAMGAGRPVICLDIGGPAHQVTDEAGFKIPANTPEQAIEDMSRAMLEIATNRELFEQKSHASRKRALTKFNWQSKGDYIDEVYRNVVRESTSESLLDTSHNTL